MKEQETRLTLVVHDDDDDDDECETTVYSRNVGDHLPSDRASRQKKGDFSYITVKS
jgi:hypothetical protein